MSYADTANRPNPAAAFGALGIPGGIGALLIVGLAVTVVPKEADTGLEGIFVDVTEVEPDDPKPTETNTQTNTTIPKAPTPTVPIESDNTFVVAPVGPIVDDFETTGGFGETIGPIALPPPPPPVPTFDPIAASPRGNPGRWITDNDYRSSWINRGYEGVAGFALQIDSEGRVSNCTITRSTGHDALDAATCRLIERRSRFDPARDSSGNITAGTYSSSVNWQIP